MHGPETTTAPAAGTAIRTLSGIADYRCGHSGSCCRAGWPIPVEAAPLAFLAQGERTRPFADLAGAPWTEDGILGRSTDNTCLFHRAAPGEGGCRIESTLGHLALPYSCRQFPRLLLADGRGWHQSLSAWCGTAARSIVTGTMAAPDRFGSPELQPDFVSFAHIDADSRVHVESLDAREGWPPLLRPGVLAGYEAYDRWESSLISDFLRPAIHGVLPLGPGIVAACQWTDLIRTWGPRDGALPVLVDRTLRTRSRWQPRHDVSDSLDALDALLNDLIWHVPSRWKPDAWPSGLTDAWAGGDVLTRRAADGALARYLAVRLVGSWVAYHGRGLRSVLASLVSAYGLASLALMRNGDGPVTFGRMTSAIRAADWLQLHLLDREAWATWCSASEDAPDARRLLSVGAAASHALDGLAWAPDPP